MRMKLNLCQATALNHFVHANVEVVRWFAIIRVATRKRRTLSSKRLEGSVVLFLYLSSLPPYQLNH